MLKSNKWFRGKKVNQSLHRPTAGPDGSRRLKLKSAHEGGKVVKAQRIGGLYLSGNVPDTSARD
jgi:hypothetical protein